MPSRWNRENEQVPPPVTLDVELYAEEPASVTPGSPILLQVRDTALQDVPATTLGETRGTVLGGQGTFLAALHVVVQELGYEPTIWAHVDVDEDGKVSKGDLVTMQLFPVSADAHPRVKVTLRRV